MNAALLLLLSSFALCALLSLLLYWRERRRYVDAAAALRERESELALLRVRCESVEMREQGRCELTDAFKALAAEVLQAQSSQFLQLATAKMEGAQEAAWGQLQRGREAIEGLLSPFKGTLERFELRVGEIERDRTTTYASLKEQIAHLSAGQGVLQREAANLVKALRQPHVRGRWGEVQLRRVVELAGMLPYCDFIEQKVIEGSEGSLRPDMVVRLPNERCLVIDSKAPLSAYLDLQESEEGTSREEALIRHARQMRGHIQQLSSKAYWSQFPSSPEFVILFIPGEPFFTAALQRDPGLFEWGVEKKVVIATPMTLIALLRTVAWGWGQERMAEEAAAVCALGRELYERLGVITDHVEEMRRGLERAIGGYNKMAASLESRVLVTARKFTECGIAVKAPLGTPEPIETPIKTHR